MYKFRTMHLFAGAGGGLLADLLLGHHPVCAVEVESYCQQVLVQRQKDGIFPWFPIFSDIETFNGEEWRGRVDVVSGGFPCQDISAAGKGEGLGGSRSGLWAEMARVISEVQPRFVFVENSPMLTSRGLGVVLGDLSTLGYDARWGVLGVRHAKGNCNRDRLWIVAGPSQELRRRVYWWPYQIEGNMEHDKPFGSLFDRYMEELDRQGKQREDQRKSDLPPYLCRISDGMAPELDELKAIGNGQSGTVAALAWNILSKDF